MATYKCGCGDVTGVACDWTGLADEMVVVEWMPEHLRGSHEAAGNAGVYPANGARRTAMERSCAEGVVDGLEEWASIRSGAKVARYAVEA
jgi:hypothetical protein